MIACFEPLYSIPLLSKRPMPPVPGRWFYTLSPVNRVYMLFPHFCLPVNLKFGLGLSHTPFFTSRYGTPP